MPGMPSIIRSTVVRIDQPGSPLGLYCSTECLDAVNLEDPTQYGQIPSDDRDTGICGKCGRIFYITCTLCRNHLSLNDHVGWRCSMVRQVDEIVCQRCWADGGAMIRRANVKIRVERLKKPAAVPVDTKLDMYPLRVALLVAGLIIGIIILVGRYLNGG